MPRQLIDYKNTVIYKIVCNDLTITNCYVGHTTSFKDRKRGHKSSCNNHNSFYIYEFINKNGGWTNWTMLEIEKFECNDANEARTRERYWYELLNADLNMLCPTNNIEKQKQNIKIYKKQYYIDNKEQIKLQRKQYQTDNKDKINKKTTCECGCIVTKRSLNEHLQSNKH